MGWTGGEFLGNELGGIEQVDPFELLLRSVGKDLDAEGPLRMGTRLDGVGEIAPMEVRVDTAGDLRLLPDQRVHAQPGGFQWNFTRQVVPSSATSRKVWTPKPPSSGRNAECRDRTCSTTCGPWPRCAA